MPSHEYHQYSNKQLFQLGRIFSLVALIILSYFIFSDIFFREVYDLAFTRILPISLFLIFYIASYTNLVEKKPDMLIAIYYMALFFLVCMSYLILIISWNTQLFEICITGIIVVCVGVFLGFRGHIVKIMIIFFIPSLLFIIYAINYLSDLYKLANLANSFTVMIGMICLYSYEEKLRKNIFAVNKKMEFMAFTDPLTKLENRRSMRVSLKQEINRHERKSISFSIIIIDIDKFKLFNDLHGHDCGDFVLIKVAETLLSNLRKQDIAARWGGEEFMILLPETDICGAKVVAEKLKTIISKSPFVFNNKLKLIITATFGVSEFNSSENIDYMIKKADEALYKGKQSGRNCVVTSE